MTTLIPGFRSDVVDTGEVSVHFATGGDGPPLLLLHSYPQTHAMWRKVAPVLAERFTVVCPDLRGYGDSGKPPGGEGHAAYAKRAMAADQVALMRALGFRRFGVAGHDRGARVAHRLALDHEARVTRLAVLDVVPTRYRFATVDSSVATKAYHWFFLIQPRGLPERLIGAQPEFFLRHTLDSWCATSGAIEAEAFAEYLRCFRDPACIHATCEDYRAAASLDLEHDEADAGRRLRCPLLVIWGGGSIQGSSYDLAAVWREYAEQVSGRALPGGHFLAEEAPVETCDALLRFFAQ
jgi:haloacetate dehalogenase